MLLNTKSKVISFLFIIMTTLAWLEIGLAQESTQDFFGEIDADSHPGYRDFVAMGCWQCHGFQGQGGDGVDGPRLAPDPLPFEAFLALVRHPANVMPAYSPRVLSDERLRRIHSYLQSIPPGPDISEIPLLSGE